jgi:hypothetical protein
VEVSAAQLAAHIIHLKLTLGVSMQDRPMIKLDLGLRHFRFGEEPTYDAIHRLI